MDDRASPEYHEALAAYREHLAAHQCARNGDQNEI